MPESTLVLGTRKGVIVLERNGSWSIVRDAHRGIPAPYADLDPRTGTLWATLDHGHWGQKLSRSPDLGRSWAEVTPPAHREGDEVRPGTPATLRYIWVFTPGPSSKPGRLYLGTEPGGLFRSDDDGSSWHIVESLWNHPSRLEHWMGGGRDEAAVHSVLIDPRDPDRIVIGVSVAGVFESTDDGASWHVRNTGLKADYLPDPDAAVGQDPHIVVRAPSDPDRLWQQNHCGIFRSDDGARTWLDVSESDGPAKFGFAIAVHEERPDTAWVVPAISDDMRIAVDGALCVCRTDDAGKTWTAHRKGLPQRHAYDVVFRHALDVQGERLVFGSTTGNLYTSEDAGKTWTCIANNLPPIYSTRFIR
jgi:hypothetical protein